MLVKKLWPSLIWALVIIALMGFPGDYFPEVHSFWDWLGPDKLVHLAVFGILTFLVFYNLRSEYNDEKNRIRLVVLILVINLAYGLLVEVLQATVFVRRDGNIYDFFANSLGVLVGWLMFRIVNSKKIKI